MHQTFSQYNLVTKLAKKYSHSTYLASPINEPEHQVVLTLFSSSVCHSLQECESLLLKAKRIKQLKHEHLVPILDIGLAEEQVFTARDYLPQGSVRSLMKSLSPQSLKLQDALKLLLQVGEALVYAHDLHIFHGSLKPENILFDANGQVVVTDFNLLSHHDLLIHDYITDEYPLCYMAPEQFFGTCDAKSDQHALGCLAYELITGRTPFVAQSSDLMHKQHSSPQPVPFFEDDAHLPPSLKAAILKTLDKDPNERFADLSLFLEIIRSTSSPLLTSAAPRFTNFHMSERQNTSFMPKVIASKRPRYTPLTKGTLGSIAEWQNASFIPKATTSDSTTPTPLMKSNLDKRPEWQMTSFTPQVVVSDPITPMPFTKSHTSAIPFPFSQRSRERLSSQLSSRSSKMRRGEGEVHAPVQGETEPNLTSEKGPSPHDASYERRTHYHSSIFLRSAIGLAVLLLVILGLVAYSLWLLRS